MPTAEQTQSNFLGELVALMGTAGGGKSTLAMQAPQPHAVLCVDKPVIAPLPAGFPDYDPAQTYGKFYPPPEKDLTDDKQFPPRIVFDQFIQDVQALKVALYKGIMNFEMGDEQWPLPRTIIIEGMDFVRDHAVNWVLNTQKKHHMDEFTTADGRPNPFVGWGLVANKMDEVFQNLAFLPSIRPVNVIVTIGLDEETKREKVNGKIEMVKTGNLDPAFGGKMSIEAPRKFRDCWLATETVGRYIVVVKPGDRYAKFRGLRSGRFWAPGVVSEKGEVDVSLDAAKPINRWNQLFGGGK